MDFDMLQKHAIVRCEFLSEKNQNIFFEFYSFIKINNNAHKLCIKIFKFNDYE